MAENGKLISDHDIEFIKEKLSSLQYLPLERFQKNIKAMSYITYLFKMAGISPIIVGGHAVELYTAGHYATFDVDVVLSGYDYAKTILERLGFKKNVGERHWYHKELALAIEIPDNILCGSMEKIVEVTVADGFVVYVIGIEDLILDRVRGSVYWSSASDREWALFLMSAQWDDIDFAYLKKEAEKESISEKTPDIFNTVMDLIKETKKLKKDDEGFDRN